MSFQRVSVSKECSSRLSILKARTGLTPNILCRVAFCLSISEPGMPQPEIYDEEGQEFNRFTLLGEWDAFFIALLKERLIEDGMSLSVYLVPQFRAHLNRGVLTLFLRVRGLHDFVELLPQKAGVPTT